jgi:hypothetical protein
LIDISSGGLLPASFQVFPGYQVSFARNVREGSVKTAAVGMLVGPRQPKRFCTAATPMWSSLPGPRGESRIGRCE